MHSPQPGRAVHPAPSCSSTDIVVVWVGPVAAGHLLRSTLPAAGSWQEAVRATRRVGSRDADPDDPRCPSKLACTPISTLPWSARETGQLRTVMGRSPSAPLPPDACPEPRAMLPVQSTSAVRGTAAIGMPFDDRGDAFTPSRSRRGGLLSSRPASVVASCRLQPPPTRQLQRCSRPGPAMTHQTPRRSVPGLERGHYDSKPSWTAAR